MTVMALTLAHTRENECDTLEGHAMYDSSGEVVGWLGQVMDESGYPCEYMGMGGEGYTSCWSSSEISRLRAENAKLKALVRDMYTCINHVTGTDVHWDCTTCPLDGTRECDFEGQMITLGVEVG